MSLQRLLQRIVQIVVLLVFHASANFIIAQIAYVGRRAIVNLRFDM